MLTGLAALSLTLTACGGGGGDGGGGGGGGDEAIDTSAGGRARSTTGSGTTRSCPSYQKCADAFKTANPNVNVKITQFAWDDYWSKLTNGFVAGTHPTCSPTTCPSTREFVTNQQLVPLDATLAKDGFNVDQYQEGLADLWKGQDGKRYGLPKDFDTIAVFYNTKLVEEAGVRRDPAGRA